eukprot:10137715-Heterocapsa_arctica.AAC.1
MVGAALAGGSAGGQVDRWYQLLCGRRLSGCMCCPRVARGGCLPMLRRPGAAGTLHWRRRSAVRTACEAWL